MNEIDPYIQRARLLLEQGRPRDAEKQLAEAARINPDDDIVLSLLGKCKYDLKQYEEGMTLIRRALSRDPQEEYYHYLLGFGAYHLNDHGNAILHLKTACSLNPYAAPYFGLWAMILIEEKMFEAALEKADEGLAVDPSEITCLNARSTALNKLKRTEDAIATMQNALQQDPENEFTHTTIGWNMLEKGRVKEASKHFSEALRINPNIESARNGLKESLKSKLPPYKWLLQYSFWVNNQGSKARWIIPIAIFFGVRVFAGVTAAAGDNIKIIGVIVVILYLAFVATSWIINPLANLVLLNDKTGRYALTSNERYNALFFAAAILAGLVTIVVGLFAVKEESISNIVIAGCILMSLALPLGHMNFPIRIFEKAPRQWLSVALLITGIVSAVAGIAGLQSATMFFTAHAITFVAFMWVHALSSR